MAKKDKIDGFAPETVAIPYEEVIKGLPKIDLRRRHDEQMAVVDAAREVAKVVRATSGSSGGHQWFKELADLLDAVEKLDGPFER